MDAQIDPNYRHRICPHFAGSDRVEDRCGYISRLLQKCSIALIRWTRQNLLRFMGVQGFGRHQLPGLLDGGYSDTPVSVG